MKYVCDRCGRMLRVDRDIDDDRVFEGALRTHIALDCPDQFVDDRNWLSASADDSPAQAATL
ncbi:MAG: hypothetical protein NVS9B12_15030 [Vulcanimicrobiaceae bacterium]